MMEQPENITVVLLAAGRGKRMQPLTDHTPKPLLRVGKYSLIEHHLRRIAQQGFKHVVINIAHLASQIPQALGNGDQYGLSIQYSDESNGGALETAGGLKNAMPLIQSDPFIVINADIWTDFDNRHLLRSPLEYARLVMVDNPSHHSDGDFVLLDNGLLSDPCIQAREPAETDHKTQTAPPLPRLTFSGIAIYRKRVFDSLSSGKQALAPIFRQLIAEGKLEGLKFSGEWRDIGTPERLEQLRANG